MKSVYVVFAALTVLLMTGMTQAETVYYWTDENGVRHFSNTGAPADVDNVGSVAGKVSPPPEPEEQAEATEGPIEQESEGQADEVLSDAPGTKSSTPTVREQAEQAQRERIARQAEEERRRLQDEISQVEQRSLSRTFTEGMRDARLEPLKEQLALLDSDPVQYFRMKQQGAFIQGGRTSSNRDRRGGRTGAMRERMQ